MLSLVLPFIFLWGSHQYFTCISVTDLSQEYVVFWPLLLCLLYLALHGDFVAVYFHLYGQAFAYQLDGIGDAEILHVGIGTQIGQAVCEDGYGVLTLSLLNGAQSLSERGVVEFAGNLRHTDYVRYTTDSENSQAFHCALLLRLLCKLIEGVEHYIAVDGIVPCLGAALLIDGATDVLDAVEDIKAVENHSELAMEETL